MPELIEEMKRVLRKAGLPEGDITEALASISIMQELPPIRDGENYRAYEERYYKLMQDAGFVVGQKPDLSWVRKGAGKNTWITFGRLLEG